MTLEEVTKRLEDHFRVHDDGKPTPYLDEAVMTMFSVLDYAKVLEDKFGSLEEAVDAEKVVHCGECIYWHSDRSYCDRPCVGKLLCPPNYYCGSGIRRNK